MDRLPAGVCPDCGEVVKKDFIPCDLWGRGRVSVEEENKPLRPLKRASIDGVADEQPRPLQKRNRLWRSGTRCRETIRRPMARALRRCWLKCGGWPKPSFGLQNRLNPASRLRMNLRASEAEGGHPLSFCNGYRPDGRTRDNHTSVKRNAALPRRSPSRLYLLFSRAIGERGPLRSPPLWRRSNNL